MAMHMSMHTHVYAHVCTFAHACFDLLVYPLVYAHVYMHACIHAHSRCKCLYRCLCTSLGKVLRVDPHLKGKIAMTEGNCDDFHNPGLRFDFDFTTGRKDDWYKLGTDDWADYVVSPV